MRANFPTLLLHRWSNLDNQVQCLLWFCIPGVFNTLVLQTSSSLLFPFFSSPISPILSSAINFDFGRPLFKPHFQQF